MNIHLLAIDPQRDFCDPTGALFVQGADQDVIRLGNMIDRLRTKINDIHVTLDSHNVIHIAHPIFWIDSKGNHPNPFTIITEDDVKMGKWTTTNPACKQRAMDYVISLKRGNRYLLCIWPQHCVIATEGWTVAKPVNEALERWCKDRFKKVDYVTKGSNVFTEHYSAVKADVPDNSDPSTMLNTELLKILAKADVILIAGEALSHCVANTITDVADNFGEDNIKKFVLLEDCCSNVGGFEKLGKDFVEAMKARGMKVAKSTEYLA